MGIVTPEMIEESKKIDLKIIDKDLYENAKATIAIHELVTGRKSQAKAMGTVILTAYIESQQNKSQD